MVIYRNQLKGSIIVDAKITGNHLNKYKSNLIQND